MQVKNLFLHLKPAESFTIEDPRLITGVPVYLTALRLSDGEFLIVASSKNDGQNALEYYKERWQIETLFSCLKAGDLISKRLALLTLNGLKNF
ncbi:MAG: hypothetical protein IPL99_29690 [Candidatus Competibacteraceae bacterium]|nr:hypothetical protein [Candidatus Competibacteraceae bacterium]MBK8755541.1 hypothetical protein [Candidatus Competibacteraceae bacterium]